MMRNIWINAHRRRAGAIGMVSLDQMDESRLYLDDIPPRTPRNELDAGPQLGRMLSTYIVEAGQTLTTLAG